MERREALIRFRHVIANWWQLVRAQRNLSLLTGGIGQANALVPVLIAAPAYFAQLLTLGSIVQVRIAYGQISGALTWFVFAYQEIARWRANVERLATFAESMDATERAARRGGHSRRPGGGPTLRLDGVRIAEPDGRVLLDGASATVAAGDRVAIIGPVGDGEDAARARHRRHLALRRGTHRGAARTRAMLFVPQWPYIPIGTLRAAVSYPEPEGTFPDDADRRGAPAGRARSPRDPARRHRGVGAAALAARAAAALDRARAAAEARLDLPRQGDVGARRGDGEARLRRC